MKQDINFQIEKISSLQEKFGIYKNIFYYKSVAEELCRLDLPTKHDFFAVVLFESGNGVHVIEDMKYSIEERQVHFLFPDQSHYWIFDNKTVVHQLFISKELFEDFRVFMQFPQTVYKKFPVLTLATEKFNKIVHECRDIGDEQLDPYTIGDHIIYLKTKIILQSISSELENVFEDLEAYQQHPVLFYFVLLIKKHYKNEKTVRFYADRLGITANYLNVLCKKYLNRKATDCIQTEVIKEVKKQVVYSTNLLLDIAWEYGFQNYPSFSKCFKKHLGTSPKQFRIMTLAAANSELINK